MCWLPGAILDAEDTVMKRQSSCCLRVCVFDEKTSWLSLVGIIIIVPRPIVDIAQMTI